MQTARLLARFLPPPPPPQHAPPPGAEQQHHAEPAWVSRLMDFYQGVLHHGRVLPTGYASLRAAALLARTAFLHSLPMMLVPSSQPW